VVWMLHSFFSDVPLEILEAADIDGCSRFQQLVLIAVPLVRTGIIAAGLLVAVFIWNEFFLAYVVLQNQEMFTLPAGLSVFRYQYSANWPYMSVALMISVIPSLALFYFCQDRLLEGWGYTSK